jgi:DNA-binding GntR family transcriptional regulator
MAPGSFVDEPSLCERLNISRTPLREALKVLSAEGLVRHEPRRGCFVSEVSEQDLDEIFPVIALLEGRCAFEAAGKASQADLQALAQRFLGPVAAQRARVAVTLQVKKKRSGE